jgi:hypothetical protein
MNVSQSNHIKNFVPPALESIWAPKSLVFLALNILTVGIFGAAETLSKKYRVKELKMRQEKLIEHANELADQWTVLEQKLTNLYQDISDRLETESEDLSEIKKDIQKLRSNLSENDELLERKFSEDYETPSSISDVALGTIDFVGQLLINVLSIGLYGVYQNCSLKNKVTILEAQNEYIKNQTCKKVEDKAKEIRTNIDAFSKGLDLIRDLTTEVQNVQQTDPGKAYLAAHQATQELQGLQKKQSVLQQDLVALRAQKVVAEQGKQKAENELTFKKQDVQNLQLQNKQIVDQERQARAKIDQLEEDNAIKEAELFDLQERVKESKTKAERARVLEKEVSRLTAVNRNLPEAQKLQTQLGPIDSKYTPKKDEPTEINGACEDSKSDYAKRYNGKRTAVDVLKAAFSFGFTELMAMAKKGKIKFSDSLAVQASPGARALYRFMILDLIKGAKLHQPSCHGYELVVNDQEVPMIPSNPERVLRYKLDDSKKLKPCVEVCFTRRDDFTAKETELERDVPFGVDPVSIKRILVQLTEEEQRHLFNLLMSSIIEDTNPEYCQTKAFMRNETDERVELIKTAYELICDMGTAVEKKFGQNILIDCWQENVDDENFDPAFVKAEDAIDVTDIPDDGLVQAPKGEKYVEWELIPEVFKDSGQTGQAGLSFQDLITFAQVKYRQYFDYLGRGLILKKQSSGATFDKLEWKEINEQYHVSHRMIGSDPKTYLGGQRCLFSNLLAVFVTDDQDLEEANVIYLKKAMAAYLDYLQKAKLEWEKIKHQDVKDENHNKLKELAELYDQFQSAIYKTHNKCTVSTYQAWLREKDLGTDRFGQDLNAKINISDLTQFEIQLCAYAMGIRIGVLPINLETRAIVDDYGRIVPEAEFYGPNTKEFLLMGNTTGSYYGLFPKLNIKNNPSLEEELETDTFEALEDLEYYWNKIDMNKKKG